MNITVKEIAGLLGGEISGDANVAINDVCKIEEGKEGGISFLSNQKYEKFIYDTAASAVVVNRDFEPKEETTATLIKVDDAYTAFSTLLEEYVRLKNLIKAGIEQPSFLGENATYGEGVYLGAFSYLGRNVVLGKNVKIYPHAFIGDNTTIGDNTIIFSGVRIQENTEIGKFCTIHPGAVIGADGFGFAPQPDGSYKPIPQVGNVKIGNHVSIGANTTIDCATMGSTIIEDGVKLDNLIQIGHNVKIGKNTAIAAQTGISGSATIGSQCVVAGQVGIAGHLNIGNNTSIGAQAGVIRNSQEGDIIVGSPAVDRKDFFKAWTVHKNLPKILKRIEDLEEKIVNSPSV